ncbi:TetR/AcrR family transcriptional regulator [Nocardioides sp. GXQ0305]|uniref:TetR/AcrR family transcriptional regulator n=1 Tax=Nocardioides sp. GXQ0305 TaxID=3423912 RepID=UPI003D7F186C
MATPREQARERTMAEIVRLGREQLATTGPVDLSVRSIARDLGVVSSAIYRYVRTRDELLTLLVVDAYGELADRVDEAVSRRRRPQHTHAQRLCASAHAVRDWALAEPARYGLLFGTPVPGYHAPGEETTPVGTRVPTLMTRLLAEAWADGSVGEVPEVRVPAALGRDLRAVRTQLGVEIPEWLLARGMLWWSSVFGAVSFEVFGQYGAGTFSDPRRLFDHHLDVLLGTVGLPPRR